MTKSNLLILFVLSLCIETVIGHAQCLANCTSQYPNPSTRSSPCCGCCYEEETCHETSATPFCCPAEHLFCGCPLNQATCSGNVDNRRSFDAFGTCYHPDTYSTCCYFSTANVWGVCPAGSSCCPSRGSVACCGADQVCASTVSDATPLCVPSNTTSTTNNNQNTNSADTNNQNSNSASNNNQNSNSAASSQGQGSFSIETSVIFPSQGNSGQSSSNPIASSGNNGQTSAFTNTPTDGTTVLLSSTENIDGNGALGQGEDNSSIVKVVSFVLVLVLLPVSYTHLTLPTT
eukprot:TRINITY_DN10809_c0_g1_i1.p1 TRINITY_DN10809_c0_g1~~TRINITY_DN10809_c0_g1_i1.p1  ORF type:complete len:330 (-),score=47.85 TRINITY_DN10809_c0_g1_i1:34-900(-)